MQIRINGEPRTLADGRSIADLLDELDLSARNVAVEVNRELVPRDAHAGHLLNEGDRLEIVTLVGGG